jgi:hypothetical protein
MIHYNHIEILPKEVCDELGSWPRLGQDKQEMDQEEIKAKKRPKTLGKWKGNIHVISRMSQILGTKIQGVNLVHIYNFSCNAKAYKM